MCIRDRTEGRQAVAYLFEPDPEATTEDVDVVSLLLRGFEKRPVKHEHGAGEVVGERHPCETARLVRREARVARDARHERALRHDRDLMGELERAAARGEQL